MSTGKISQSLSRHLLRSRYLQAAVAREAEPATAGSLDAIGNDPVRISKLLAKSFYKEMAAAGFGSDHIITATTEIISLLNENLGKN